MLQNERQEKILEILKANHSVKVTQLAQELESSESTIRRDITELDSMGKLKKVFGGAIALHSEITVGKSDVAERNLISFEEKDDIAQYAAKIIEDGDFVFIDAGTTTIKMIQYLEDRDVTFVTNGISHAKKLVEKGFDVYMVGGLLRHTTEAVTGEGAIQSIRQYNFTKCFVGANGVDLERGLTTPDISEAAIKGAVMKQSHITYILADHTKFGKISSVTFGKLDEAVIITDELKLPQYREKTVIEEVKKVIVKSYRV